MKRFLLAALATLIIALAVILAANARHAVIGAQKEAVLIPSGEILLAGTLIVPEGPGPHPAVLMLHGSGPEPRLELPDHAVINVLADNGFAVLAYDKRGVGESGGDFDAALYRDFIDDALAALDFMAGRSDIDGELIGLYTVSESGWFGPEIAVRSGNVDFIFNKVASPLSWMETVAWETRNDLLADGIREADVDRVLQHTLDRWNYYIAAASDPELASGPERAALAGDLATLRADVQGAEAVLPERVWAYDAENYSRFAADASYSPVPFIATLDIPMYFAYGGRDINIPTTRCVTELERLIAEHGRDIEYHVYPDLGHALASPAGLLRLGWPSGYLDELARWTAERAPSERSE